MKLGLSLGYWGSTPPTHHVGMAQKAESLGYDSVWTAEAYGSDAITPLAWIGAQTSKIRPWHWHLPNFCAHTYGHGNGGLNHGPSLERTHDSGPRVSGPQVVEGWYGGPFSKPLSRTREYISIIKKFLLARSLWRTMAPLPLALYR